jgi:hypothetical protein
MALLMARLQVEDYEAWKRDRFDADATGRLGAATGHRIYRSTENDNEVFVQVEFPSAEEAVLYRERLLDSGALEGVRASQEPGVVEEEEAVTY